MKGFWSALLLTALVLISFSLNGIRDELRIINNKVKVISEKGK